MKVRASELDVPQNNPFEQCKLGRGALAEPLTNLVGSATEGMVMSIHAPWGQGKSTFFRMWHRHLLNQGFIVVGFNAWETDFAEDPMLAILGEVGAQLEDALVPSGVETEAANLLRQQIKTATRFGAKLAKRVIPLAIRVASAGTLDANDAWKTFADELADQADAYLQGYADSRTSIERFRTELSGLAQHVVEKQGGKPLIFLVDELDRCRPDYALRVLECIKHFFNVPGTVFVMGIDRNQLIESAKTQYGQAMEAKDYLRRFFDLDFTLPMAPIGHFADAQLEMFGINLILASQPSAFPDRTIFQRTLPQVIKAFGCSPRDVQKLMGQLNFVLRIWDAGSKPPLTSTFVAVAIRLKAEQIYYGLDAYKDNGEKLWIDLQSALPSLKTVANQDESLQLEAAVIAMVSTNKKQMEYVSRRRSSIDLSDTDHGDRLSGCLFDHEFQQNWGSAERIRKCVDLGIYVEA